MSKELKKFKEENPDLFLKNGELKSEFRLAEEVIKQIKKDPMFMKYIGGKHQKIMTGIISNIPVKIKIDCLHDTCITDLKIIKDMNLIWNEKTRQKENFVDFYRVYNTSSYLSRSSLSTNRKKITIYYSCSD